MVRSFVWRDVSGTVGGGRSNGRWTVVSSDIVPLLKNRVSLILGLGLQTMEGGEYAETGR